MQGPIRSFFFASPVITPAPAPVVNQNQQQLGAAQEEAHAAAAFINLSSLGSFGGATAAIAIVTHFFCFFVSKLSDHYYVTATTAIVSILIGLALFALNVTDPPNRPKNVHEWLATVVIGIVNTAQLGCASLGISTALQTATGN
jgi:hypothetical protein